MTTQEKEVQTETFKNDHLSVQVSQQPRCFVKMDIKVEPKAVVAAFEKAIRNVSKEVSVPGFRKGKAPEKFIKEKYAKPIHDEWMDIVLQTAFQDALELTNIHPFKDGKIKRPAVKECTKENGAQFTIEFEVIPKVPTITPENLRIHKHTPVPITDKEIDNALKNIALQFATYDEVENRGIEEGDFVNLDVDLIEDGSPRRVIQNQRTQVSEDGLPIWIRNKIIGLKRGETASGTTEKDAEVLNPDFKPTPFNVTVDGIWTGTVPAIDDELAKKVGLQTAEELRTKLKERLENDAKDEAEEKILKELDTQLLEKFPFEIPQSLIDHNLQLRIDDYIENLQKHGREEIWQNNKTAIRKEFEKITLEQLQLIFILRKLAADLKMDVTNEEMGHEFTRQISLMQKGQANLDLNDKEALRDHLHSNALTRKIKQFLLDKATEIK